MLASLCYSHRMDVCKYRCNICSSVERSLDLRKLVQFGIDLLSCFAWILSSIWCSCHYFDGSMVFQSIGCRYGCWLNIRLFLTQNREMENYCTIKKNIIIINDRKPDVHAMLCYGKITAKHKIKREKGILLYITKRFTQQIFIISLWFLFIINIE